MGSVKTRILLTGANGLLGQKIVYALLKRDDVELLATGIGPNRTSEKTGYKYESLDITDPEAIKDIFNRFKPDCLINPAAMTNVDGCEKDKEKCRKANVDAVSYMIEQCEKYNTHLVHLSTDFVFDGSSGPYKEDDKPNPQSYYAQSKLDSEILCHKSNISWSILRTIIIYGVVDDNQRSNVVLWTKNSLEQKKNINVISDQFRSPTLAEDLADACVQAALRKAQGIYHVCGREHMSILEIVNQVADYFKLDKQYINPISSADLNQPAKRPPVTGFVIDKAIKELGYKPHSFEEGLRIVEEQLIKIGA